MTREGAFRVITAVTTRLVDIAVSSQGAHGETARRLGELITGAILLREAMAPDRRVQTLIKSRDGRAHLVADAHPDGRNRGIVRTEPSDDDQATEGPDQDDSNLALLEVIYTLPNGVVHQGTVALPQGGDISAGLMTYLQESEQVVSMIGVTALFDPGNGGVEGSEPTIRAAGGYMVQLMPDADRDALTDMTRRLEAADELGRLLAAPGISADGLRQGLLGELPVDPMNETPLRFGCNCGRARILTGLASLAKSEIAAMLAEGEPLDIRCETCKRSYTIAINELRQFLLDNNNRLQN